MGYLSMLIHDMDKEVQQHPYHYSYNLKRFRTVLEHSKLAECSSLYSYLKSKGSGEDSVFDLLSLEVKEKLLLQNVMFFHDIGKVHGGCRGIALDPFYGRWGNFS